MALQRRIASRWPASTYFFFDVIRFLVSSLSVGAGLRDLLLVPIKHVLNALPRKKHNALSELSGI